MAQAALPSNDDFDSAVTIINLPFNTTLVTTEATAAADDPTSCTNNGSVWFSFTPASDMIVDADTFGSGYDTVLIGVPRSSRSQELWPSASERYDCLSSAHRLGGHVSEESQRF